MKIGVAVIHRRVVCLLYTSFVNPRNWTQLRHQRLPGQLSKDAVGHQSVIPLKSPHRLIQFCIKHAADLRDRISQRPQGVLRYADLSVLISFLNLRKRYEIARRFILMMQMGFNPGMLQIGKMCIRDRNGITSIAAQ